MKRSQINAILTAGDEFSRSNRFALPPFAYWDAEEWQSRRGSIDGILAGPLGWDITDFGTGDYDHHGLFLFTIRNGSVTELRRGGGRVYAEKLLLVGADQLTPFHYHEEKTEDIINRGGGTLCLRLRQIDAGRADNGAVSVVTDGVGRTVPAGDTVRLSPGESITLPPRLSHEFWAEGSMVLGGEVSSVNDDASDNYFMQPVGRFPTIDEDEPPKFLLVGDYGRLR